MLIYILKIEFLYIIKEFPAVSLYDEMKFALDK